MLWLNKIIVTGDVAERDTQLYKKIGRFRMIFPVEAKV